MKKTIVFKTWEEYENWTDQFDGCYEYQEIPTAIDEGWQVMTDLMTPCKSWKTALKRFEKAFGDVNTEIHTWVECMWESCESGYFKDHHVENPPFTNHRYGWGVEEVDDGYWYIFLNLSGIYAGR